MKRNELIEKLNREFDDTSVKFYPYNALEDTGMIKIGFEDKYINHCVSVNLNAKFYEDLINSLKEKGIINFSFNNTQDIFWAREIEND